MDPYPFELESLLERDQDPFDDAFGLQAFMNQVSLGFNFTMNTKEQEPT